MKTNKLLEYCRIIAAVLMLSAALSLFDSLTVLSTALKYAAFSLCLFIAGFKITKKQFELTMSSTVVCVMLTVCLSCVISYIMPASSGIELSALTIISAVIIAPIFEELFFRAALSSLPIYHLSSSFIFALFHGSDFLQAFILGFMLSAFYKASGKITVPIIAHTANNLLAVICMFFDVRPYALAVSCLTAGIIIYRKRK